MAIATKEYQNGDKPAAASTRGTLRQYGRKHGRGVVTFADGNRYEGEWREGNIHGPGVYFDKSGEKLAEGRATDGCFGKRNGTWVVWGKSAKACGFK